MHRIPCHESKCRAYHGHRQAAEIMCLAPEPDEPGRMVNFGAVQERVRGWINQCCDHSAILLSGYPNPAVRALAEANERHRRPVYRLVQAPTVEVIVAELARVAQALLWDTGVTVVRIRRWETLDGLEQWTRSSLWD